jgi:hypothetical protein
MVGRADWASRNRSTVISPGDHQEIPGINRLAIMKRDIEHVVTSTAMFVIAFLLSSAPDSTPPRRRSRRPGGPSLVWFAGVALLTGALVWTTNVYVAHVAFCARLRLSPPPGFRPAGPPPTSPEILDLTAMSVEGLLLTALVVLAIRSVRRRRRLAG